MSYFATVFELEILWYITERILNPDPKHVQFCNFVSDEQIIMSSALYACPVENGFCDFFSQLTFNKLGLVHTDVCRPMRTSSLDNSKYFRLFIDDYSRMTWVYFFKERSEIFKIFSKFKSHVEKESGYKIKCLWSHKGT